MEELLGIKFRAINHKTNYWFDESELVFHNGQWYQDWRSFEDGFALNMNECMVMQYTGLKDKNGVEIYEGDILCGWIGSHWHSGEDKFEEVVKYDEKTASYNFPAIEVRYGDLRVIGNIFENQALLETE